MDPKIRCQLPLLLLALLPLAYAASVAVHDAAISVTSLQSVVYRNAQISLFRSEGHLDRLFHQPLSFLDTSSVIVRTDREINRTLLYLDVYLWTDEFIQLVRSKGLCRNSVELMPLTHLQLTWAEGAAESLGRRFNESYRLTSSWRDGDRPLMRTTFAVECLRGVSSCVRLGNRLQLSAVPILDLRYRVRGDSSEQATLTIRATHLWLSDTFRLLTKFSASRRIRQIIVPDETVDNLVKETLAAVLYAHQQETGKEISNIDPDNCRVIEQSLSKTFRSNPVLPRADQWKAEIYWPGDKMNLRSDRLATMLNRLLTYAGSLKVQLSNKSEEVLLEVTETMRASDAGRVKAFADSYKSVDDDLINVKDVIALVESLQSHVGWNGRKFVAASRRHMYELDLADWRQQGTLLTQRVQLLVRHSLHRDHVTPVDINANASLAKSDLCPTVAELDRQLHGLRHNLSASVETLEARLNDWMQQLAPVQQRSAGEVVGAAADPLRHTVETLATDVRRLERRQRRLPESFCIIANVRDPAGMHCDTIGFHIPYKSLRHSPFFDRRVRYKLASIGGSSFTRANSRFFKLQIRICCTV